MRLPAVPNFNLEISMPSKIETAYNQVRQELCELGLLADGIYLDKIYLVQTSRLVGYFANADGFVYDEGVDPWMRILMFEEGVIYVPTQLKDSHLNSAYSLTDVVRHEFAHAWYWLDKRFVDGPWFKKAFGRAYASQECTFGSQVWQAFDAHPDEFKKSGYAKNFVTPYAMTSTYEDFAETFRFYLRNQNSLHKYKSRTGVFKKVMAVQAAVARKARKLGLE